MVYKNKEINRNLKYGDTKIKKYRCSFRLCEDYMTSNVWKFIMVCGVYNYDLDQKLLNHHIFDLINVDEKKFTVLVSHNKNMRVSCMLDVKIKNLKAKDQSAKNFKSKELSNIIMQVWETVINS